MFYNTKLIARENLLNTRYIHDTHNIFKNTTLQHKLLLALVITKLFMSFDFN